MKHKYVHRSGRRTALPDRSRALALLLMAGGILAFPGSSVAQDAIRQGDFLTIDLVT